MIRITKLTDYGIVLLTHIAGDGNLEGVHTARDLAAQTHIPQPMVGKILKALARKGFLHSHRGVKGGYSLARPAGEISVVEIIDALEGPISITECIDHAHSNCSVESFCPCRGNWRRINSAIRNALEGITLEGMTHPLSRRKAVEQTATSRLN